MNFWAKDYNTTTLAMYRKGKDGRNYHILFNGRTPSADIPCAKHNVIFNNTAKNPTFNSNTGYKLTQYNLSIVRS
jgi:hypothetical protein